MTVTTTAPQAGWEPGVAEVRPPLVEIDLGEPDEERAEHVKLVATGEVPEPDPAARLRMAGKLFAATGWNIFPEVAGDREYVSRLWAEDWDSPEDAIYDDTE